MPNSIVAGDFNGDGNLDLAVVNSDADTVTILLGNGDGTFNAANSPATGDSPVSIAIGDFNGDGIPDLAVVNGTYLMDAQSSPVTILLGNGDGTFTAMPISPSVGPYPVSIAVGDFNGDGNEDLVVGNVDDTLTVLMGNGNGTFTAAPISPAAGGYPHVTAVSDFNGDGNLDLAVANGNEAIKILLGDGDGTFVAAEGNPNTSASVTSLATGDFNGDGIPDLVAVQQYNNSLAVVATNLTTVATASASYITIGGTSAHAVDAQYAGDSVNAASTSSTVSLGATNNAATPVFNPAQGTYTTPQTVSISDATAGATIYYTIDGTTPGAGSFVYSNPITVSARETVRAIAVASGYSSSAVASAAYVITPPATAPTFQPAAGTYTTPQKVTISDATAGATIYYTTNGSAPTTGTSVYSGPITVSASETVRALASGSGYSASTVASAAYVITPPATAPTFQPAAGTYTTPQKVTISDSTPGAVIYYTTNGNTPTTGSSVYSGPITVSSSETIRAVASGSGYSASTVASAPYVITPPAATPTFLPAAGTYTTPQKVTISDSTPGAVIYYTTNGVAPTTSSAVYSGPITVSSSETIRAVASGSGYSASTVASAPYVITPPAATPTFLPAAGTYTTPQKVTISDSTPGAVIYYTTNGIAPTTSSAVYSGPITASSSETIRAMASGSGYSASTVASAPYVITPPAATPTFLPAAGTYTTPQKVTISDSTPGAVIYYTTNGIAPTTSSAVYSGPITVSASETLKALASDSGYSASTVASAAYVITPPAATPMFLPAAGTYTSPQKVTISDSTPGAVIYYTTDGSAPTTSSLVYSGPITVSASETIKALASGSGYSASTVASAPYVITPPAATPTFLPVAGTYTTPRKVTIAESTPGAVIYYTTNGNTPTTSSPVYSGPITVSVSETVKALASGPGYSASTEASAAYVITPPGGVRR